jgi:two-component system NarL family sensor kinase
MLVAAKFQFESAERLLDATSSGCPAELKTGLRQLGAAIVAVREVSHEMRPLELDQLGLDGALRQLTLEFAERSGLLVEFDAGTERLELSEEAAVALFRIAQEALANVVRHAQASQVRVRLSQRAGQVRLEVHDDGRGFDTAGVARGSLSGIGLRNMRERVEHLGGRFALSSVAGRTELQVCLPATERRSALLTVALPLARPTPLPRTLRLRNMGAFLEEKRER